jgi:4-alpha-glucanotransferase
MKFERASGVLLHPTSLPGAYGVGDIGAQAQSWIDFLARAGCGLWQVLPLGPTGYGDSPYQCFSAFAGNPYLISLESLLKDGLLQPEDLQDPPFFGEDQIDFGAMIPWKLGVLDRAYQKFDGKALTDLRAELNAFRKNHANWLEDYALFMALKEAHGGAPWHSWEEPLRQRQPDALIDAHQNLVEAIERQIFMQFLFFRQWTSLRQYAHSKGIQIIGDVPIFVAHDSADVWAHSDLFYLDEMGNPTVVAGVPPDYFSPTGQLWGNPLYRWDVHAANGYSWWLDRLRAVLQMVDYVRLDHFRGFSACWEVPAGLPTAEKGRWVPGPGIAFFNQVEADLGELPLIAEDLGEITPDVFTMRDDLNLPGMKILQFAFDGPENKFLPHQFVRNCVAYTGSHDNDTTLGWYATAPEKERDFCRRYLARDGHDIAWDLIRAGWSSVAVFALAPLQDLLSLGTEARMNFPGQPCGNWVWRVRPSALHDNLVRRLYEFNLLYSRLNIKETSPTEPVSISSG